MGTNNELREALKELLDAMYDMGIDEETVSIAAESPNCHMHSKEHLDAIKKANAALAEPAKNCEVGTAEEQCRRWRLFCDAITSCEKCPCQKSSDEISAYCFSRWAQMPYVEKERSNT